MRKSDKVWAIAMLLLSFPVAAIESGSWIWGLLSPIIVVAAFAFALGIYVIVQEFRS